MFQHLFCIPVLLAIIISAADFRELPIITLENGGTYYLRAEYCTMRNSEFIMNGRCYSFSSDGRNYLDASSPGPTLKMIAGTSVNIVFENNFVNTLQDEANCPQYENGKTYCDMDVTNLHTHGLHISSEQDDVLVDIHPKQSANDNPIQYTYTYSILAEHYPGIHWYHPHNHGSVSHQVHFGMFGALLVEYPSNIAATAYVDNVLYTDGGDNAYKTNILVFSSVYAVNTDICNNCAASVDLESVSANYAEGPGAYGRCQIHGRDCFHIYSVCYEYCKFEGSKATSNFIYDVNIISTDSRYDGDGIDQFVLVNGDYNPTLAITKDKFRRLQFLNTLHQYYIHYRFPAPNDCKIYLLGYDGVFFDAMRDLGVYNNELILAPGSRGDLLIKCFNINQYVVTTISRPGDSSMDETQFDALERVGSDQADGIKNLFTISVVENAGDTIDRIPNGFPRKPEYLKDLRTIPAANVDSTCACNQYVGTTDCGADECCIWYNSKTAFHVNGETFQGAGRYLTYLIQDRVYEFTLKTDRHVHHQHTYPFQLQSNIGDNGFIGQSGDYFDTLGAEFERKIRMYTADFYGYMVIHCHILPHEDDGMMGLIYVLSQAMADGTVPAPNPTSSPTDACLADLNNVNNAQSGSVSLPSVSPATEPISGGGGKTGGGGKSGGGGGGRRGESVLFDFKVTKNDALLILVSIFMILTLFNTVMICKSSKRRNGAKKYSFVNPNEIDDDMDVEAI